MSNFIAIQEIFFLDHKSNISLSSFQHSLSTLQIMEEVPMTKRMCGIQGILFLATERWKWRKTISNFQGFKRIVPLSRLFVILYRIVSIWKRKTEVKEFSIESLSIILKTVIGWLSCWCRKVNKKWTLGMKINDSVEINVNTTARYVLSLSGGYVNSKSWGEIIIKSESEKTRRTRCELRRERM